MPYFYFTKINNHWINKTFQINLLLFFFLTASCGLLPKAKDEKYNSEEIYKKDAYVCVNGVCSEGAVVVPRSMEYRVKVKSKVNLDLLVFSTCHREVTSQEYSRGGFFGMGGNKEFEGNYSPTMTIENEFCPVYITGYSKSGYNSTAFIDFETAEAGLGATLNCNGVQSTAKGVSVCQSKAGLIEVINLDSPATVGDAGPNCKIGSGKNKRWEFAMPKGECVFAFFSEDGRIHRLTTLGYTRINIGE